MGIDVYMFDKTYDLQEVEEVETEEIEEEEDYVEAPIRDTGFDINLYKQMLIKMLDERHLTDYKFKLEDLEKVADERLQVSACPNGVFEIKRTKYE